MSVVYGIRETARTYFNETGSCLHLLCVSEDDYSSAVDELGGSDWLGPIEIDGILVTTIDRLRRL